MSRWLRAIMAWAAVVGAGAPADTDADGDLDLADFAGLQRCFADSSAPCTDQFDLDASGIVDGPDYQTFASGVTGPWE